jgi:hypothetical protein
MPATLALTELDEATREYLLTVRGRQGKGMPGIFVPKSNAMPVVGCILGPIIMAVVVIFTIVPDQIYKDPNALAFLQTAGIMLGGWMVFAALRSWLFGKTRSTAGHWIYGDSLFLYEAKAEQITVTPMKPISEATATHNTSNGSYQNTVLVFNFSDNRKHSITITDQRRAEALVTYYNYLAWARGSEGGERSTLPPAVLGGMAKYVAKNDQEPLEPDGGINLNAIELESQAMPEEPQKVRSALPNLFMYLFLLGAGVACYFFMREVDIPMRDDAIYTMVTTEPVQPVFLRQYLMDDRNTLHREDVIKKLAPFYEKPIVHVRAKVRDAKLREGMVKLLESLAKADQPVVSMKITEVKTPASAEAGREERVKQVRELLARFTSDTFTRVWEADRMPDPNPWENPPPKMGEQLMFFTEAPEGTNAHLDIAYQFVPVPGEVGRYNMKADIAIRDDVEGNQTWKGEFYSTQVVLLPKTSDEREKWAEDFATSLKRALVGDNPVPKVNNPGF